MLKFNLSPKFSTIIDDTHEIKNAGLHANNNANGDVTATTASKSRGGGAGYHYPSEECNGMLRIWDGPLREVPTCSDLNWYDVEK